MLFLIFNSLYLNKYKKSLETYDNLYKIFEDITGINKKKQGLFID